MKHRRSEEFARALGDHDGELSGRWTDVAADPNAAAALARRAAVLRAAWRPPIPDRVAFLEERCRGRRILDIGCVAHDVERMDSPGWLHGRLAAVAERCIGVDVVADGVAAMRDDGYDVVFHDLRDGLGPLLSELPFAVIVAGELIEHVESLDMLFRSAREALAAEGELLVTTPNPYAPHRVRAGQLGLVWENVDHVMYAFPSGVAELAERHGMLLAEAAVTDERQRVGLVDRARTVRRRLQGRQWRTVGYATIGQRRTLPVSYGPVGRALHGMWWPGRRFLGETFLYVIRRSPGPTRSPSPPLTPPGSAADGPT